MEKRDPMGVPLPTRGPEVWPSTSYQVCEHAPQVFFKSQAPKQSQGSAGSLPAGSDPTGLLHCEQYICSYQKSSGCQRCFVRSARHLFARPAMKYQFMAEQRHEYPMTIMCRVLEVSVSGYYSWCQRPPSQHSREDARLAEQVKMAFQANRRVDGSPRVHAELQAQGTRVRASEWLV
jgi:hypothetical protein